MASKMKPNKAPAKTAVATAERDQAESFYAIVRLIDAARQRAYQAVNTALIDLYWQIGEHISRKIVADEWGEGVQVPSEVRRWSGPDVRFWQLLDLRQLQVTAWIDGVNNCKI